MWMLVRVLFEWVLLVPGIDALKERAARDVLHATNAPRFRAWVYWPWPYISYILVIPSVL